MSREQKRLRRNKHVKETENIIGKDAIDSVTYHFTIIRLE